MNYDTKKWIARKTDDTFFYEEILYIKFFNWRCNTNTLPILNNYLCGACEIWQVATVARFS